MKTELEESSMSKDTKWPPLRSLHVEETLLHFNTCYYTLECLETFFPFKEELLRMVRVIRCSILRSHIRILAAQDEIISVAKQLVNFKRLRVRLGHRDIHELVSLPWGNLLEAIPTLECIQASVLHHDTVFNVTRGTGGSGILVQQTVFWGKNAWKEW